jgi:hypothetical protein
MLAAAPLPLLFDVTLNHGTITDVGVAKLCAALTPSSVLSHLDLTHNAISAKGLTALAELVQRLPVLWLVQVMLQR